VPQQIPLSTRKNATAAAFADRIDHHRDTAFNSAAACRAYLGHSTAAAFWNTLRVEIVQTVHTASHIVCQRNGVTAVRTLEPIHGGEKVLRLQKAQLQLSDFLPHLFLCWLGTAPTSNCKSSRYQSSNNAQDATRGHSPRLGCCSESRSESRRGTSGTTSNGTSD
jgi:hypothetical protein